MSYRAPPPGPSPPSDSDVIAAATASLLINLAQLGLIAWLLLGPR